MQTIVVKNSFAGYLFGLLFVALFVLSEPAKGQITFSFTLNSSARTSAGVFKADGTLVKTLWSGLSYAAGTHTGKWDGTDDEGKMVAGGSYQIKVVSNNVSYEWEGVIGNNSTALIGPTKHRALDGYTGMAISGTNMYIGAGYNEGESASYKASTLAPFSRIELLPTTYPGPQEVDAVATDGVSVYWGGCDPYSTNKDDSFIIATNVSNDEEKIFSSGVAYKPKHGFDYKSMINRVYTNGSRISGIAVQKNGNYLFVARKGLNTLYVLNKTTGAQVSTFTYASVRGITVGDGDDNSLWMITGTNIVTKHTINTNGSLSAAVVTISDLISPLFAAVSPDNSTLILSEGGVNQRLKPYNPVTGASMWTLGQVGGYATNSTVTNDKFHFTDQGSTTRGGWISFQPDGSFWVGDNGNQRYQHYSPNREFIDRISYMRRLYNIAVDRNNPNRVFAEWLEYEIDYSKPLAPDNGSWVLKNNWAYNLPNAYNKEFAKMRYVTTMSNGRTYGFAYHIPTNEWEVYELVSGRTMRLTGVRVNIDYYLAANGDIERSYKAGTDAMPKQGFSKKPLTGFDALANPIWGAETTRLVTSTIAGTKYPWDGSGSGGAIKPWKVTSSNILVLFEGGLADKYHLAGMRTNSPTTEVPFLWKAAPTWTASSREDPYPTDGKYEIGNEVNGAGNLCHVFGGRNIIWGYNGEFWRGAGGQTNKWTHVWDNGLLIHTFGAVRRPGDFRKAVAGMAGNSFSSEVIEHNGIHYLYHGDESTHAGIHRWKITGLNTIREQSISVRL